MKVLVYKAPYPFHARSSNCQHQVFYQEAVAICRLVKLEYPEAEFTIVGTKRDSSAFNHILHSSEVNLDEYDMVCYMDWSTSHEAWVYRESPPYLRAAMVKAQRERGLQCWQFIVDFRCINRLPLLANHVARLQFPNEVDWDAFADYTPDRVYVTCSDIEAYKTYIQSVGHIAIPKRVSTAPLLRCPDIRACPEFFEYCEPVKRLPRLTREQLATPKIFDLVFYSGPKMTTWRLHRLDYYVKRCYEEGLSMAVIGYTPNESRLKTKQWQAVKLLGRVPQKDLGLALSQSKQVLLTTDLYWASCQPRILRVLECVKLGVDILADEKVNWGDFSSINFDRELLSEEEIFAC